MSSPLLTALIYSIIPSAVAVITAFLATIWRPNATFRSAVLHFAAGVVFAVVSTELLPEILGRPSPTWVIVGFVPGVLLMLLVHWLTEGGAGNEDEKAKQQEEKQGGAPMGLIMGDVVDQVISGLLLGIGIISGQHLGLLLSFAMTIEDVTFGLAIATLMSAAGIGRGPTLVVAAALGAEFVVISILTVLLVPAHAQLISTLVISFGSAALLFVVTEQLLVEAHEQRRATLLSGGFFVGFLLLLVIGMLS